MENRKSPDNDSSLDDSVPERKPGRRRRIDLTRRFLRSVGATQLALLLVVLVPVLLVQAGIYYRWFVERRSAELDANLEIARALSATFDGYVVDILRQEFVLGAALVSPNAPVGEQANQLLADVARENPTARDFAWIDPAGRVLASSNPEAVGQDRGDRPHMQAIVAGREWFVTDLMQTRIDGEPAFFIARGIRDASGNLRGVVVAVVNPDSLGAVLDVERMDLGTFGILDRQRQIVYRYPEAPLTWRQRTGTESGTGAVPALRGEEVVGTFTSPLDGLVRINAFVPIHSVGWVARAGRLESAVMAPLVGGLLRDSALALAVVLVGFLTALAISRRISRPARRLREHALAVGRGQFDLRIEVSGPIEMEELAAAFNRMAAELGEQQRALGQAKEKAESLYRVVPSAIFTVDRERRITSWNNKAAETTGYSEAEVIGRPCWSFALSPCKLETCGLFSDTLSKPIVGAECMIRRKDGKTLLISKNADLLMGPDGDVAGGVESFEDITDRRRMEEQLLRAQRLETAGLMAGQVAHDFNNLLAPFTAYPELIKMQLPGDHPAVQYCDAMLEAADQMAEINGDMMALARRGQLEEQPTDVNRLMSQAVQQMPERPSTLVVRLELAPDLRAVNGSPAQLLRVITNLVSNARGAMKDVGILTLETENVRLDRPNGHYNRIEVGDYVRLSVGDTGCGIPPEIRGRIFDAFFTTRSAGKRRGSGLGLTIVQSIVGDHKGYVDLESEVGKGTTFRVYLPASREPLGAVGGDRPRGGAETLLVVDDDPVQREAVTEMLRRLGYRVEAVAGGDEAVAHLATRTADLLILDMIMPPGMDGAETYRRVLELRPGQRAIIVSGFAESERVSMAQTLGAGAYVRKPVTLEKLARAVRQELERPLKPVPASGMIVER